MLDFPLFDTIVLSRWLCEREVRLICRQLSSVAYEIYNTQITTRSANRVVSMMEALSACGCVRLKPRNTTPKRKYNTM